MRERQRGRDSPNREENNERQKQMLQELERQKKRKWLEPRKIQTTQPVECVESVFMISVLPETEMALTPLLTASNFFSLLDTLEMRKTMNKQHIRKLLHNSKQFT